MPNVSTIPWLETSQIYWGKPFNSSNQMSWIGMQLLRLHYDLGWKKHWKNTFSQKHGLLSKGVQNWQHLLSSFFAVTAKHASQAAWFKAQNKRRIFDLQLRTPAACSSTTGTATDWTIQEVDLGGWAKPIQPVPRSQRNGWKAQWKGFCDLFVTLFSARCVHRFCCRAGCWFKFIYS